MKQYKNFIVTGCSYSCGPMVPTEEDHWSWSHLCLESFVCEHKNYRNFAIPGGGNTAAMTNLIYFLETNPDWSPKNTRIGFNITGLDRQDAIVSAEHAKALAMRAQYHIREDLQIGWLINSVHPDSRLYIEQQQIQTCLAVIQALTYLDHHGFDYFFMLLNQSIYNFSPRWFQQVLDQHRDRWLQFDAGGMYERVKSAGLIDLTEHPTLAGYQLLANDVIKYLESK